MNSDSIDQSQSGVVMAQATLWERGASLVEYALLCSMVAIAALAGMRLLGSNVSSQFSSVATQLG